MAYSGLRTNDPVFVCYADWRNLLNEPRIISHIHNGSYHPMKKNNLQVEKGYAFGELYTAVKKVCGEKGFSSDSILSEEWSWATSHSEELSVSTPEAFAVRMYTLEQPQFYLWMNRDLFEYNNAGEAIELQLWHVYLFYFINAMKKLCSCLPAPSCDLYRGAWLPREAFQYFVINNEVKFQGATSATTSMQTAVQRIFASMDAEAFDKVPVLFIFDRLVASKAACVAGVSKFPDEEERLFPPFLRGMVSEVQTGVEVSHAGARLEVTRVVIVARPYAETTPSVCSLSVGSLLQTALILGLHAQIPGEQELLHELRLLEQDMAAALVRYDEDELKENVNSKTVFMATIAMSGALLVAALQAAPSPPRQLSTKLNLVNISIGLAGLKVANARHNINMVGDGGHGRGNREVASAIDNLVSNAKEEEGQSRLATLLQEALNLSAFDNLVSNAKEEEGQSRLATLLQEALNLNLKGVSLEVAVEHAKRRAPTLRETFSVLHRFAAEYMQADVSDEEQVGLWLAFLSQTCATSMLFDERHGYWKAHSLFKVVGWLGGLVSDRSALDFVHMSHIPLIKHRYLSLGGDWERAVAIDEGSTLYEAMPTDQRRATPHSESFVASTAACRAVSRIYRLRVLFSRLSVLLVMGLPDAGKSKLLSTLYGCDTHPGESCPTCKSRSFPHPRANRYRPALLLDMPGLSDCVSARADLVRLTSHLTTVQGLTKIVWMLNATNLRCLVDQEQAWLQATVEMPRIIIVTKIDLLFQSMWRDVPVAQRNGNEKVTRMREVIDAMRIHLDSMLQVMGLGQDQIIYTCLLEEEDDDLPRWHLFLKEELPLVHLHDVKNCIDNLLGLRHHE